ncbi:MAG: PilZ domain-containing protein [Chloroflexi bacterium]|nr:PilZ domain-containing protein [Chloroflexota bacterium]
MTAPTHLPGITAGQSVVLLAGDDSDLMNLTGTIVGTGQRTLAVHLDAVPIKLDLLAVGAAVRFSAAGGALRRARVVWGDSAGSPLLVLEETVTRVGPSRRRQRRVDIRGLLARVSMFTRTGALSLKVRVVDLSVGGACLASHRAVARGQRVTVHLPPSAREAALDVAGNVVWSRPRQGAWLVGVEFEHVAEQQRDVLRRRMFSFRYRGDRSEDGS